MSGKKQAGATLDPGAAFRLGVLAAEAQTFRRDLALLAPQPLPDRGFERSRLKSPE